MKNLIPILILSTQLISAQPLLEAINQSNVAEVASLLEGKSYSKKVLKDLLDQALVVSAVRATKELHLLDLSNRVGGSALCFAGASLIADGVLTSPYCSDAARKMGQMPGSKDPLRRGPKNYLKIVGGALASGIGYYFAQKGFKQSEKESLKDNSQAIEAIFLELIDKISAQDKELLPTTLSLKEARLCIEDAIVSSDFYAVCRAVQALSFHGVTLSGDRVDYAHLASQILSERKQEITFLSSGADIAKAGLGASGILAGVYGILRGASKLLKTRGFERSRKVALAEYGSSIRILGAGMIGASLAKYCLSDGSKATRQKRRLFFAERIEQFIRERS